MIDECFLMIVRYIVSLIMFGKINIMIQKDLFPYLIDHDLIENYLNSKKEIKKINREIGKIARTKINNHITGKYLKKKQEKNIILFEDFYLYRLDKELEKANDELLFHYKKRKKYLIKVILGFQYLIT